MERWMCDVLVQFDVCERIPPDASLFDTKIPMGGAAAMVLLYNGNTLIPFFDGCE